MDLTNLFGIKYIFTLVGGWLLIIGASIEPSIGIWVISLGGSLLIVSLGKDQTLMQIVLHLIMGLFWGIFGSQVFLSWYPSIPQLPIAFFSSVFGVNIMEYFIRNLKSNTLAELIDIILDKIIPWNKKKGE